MKEHKLIKFSVFNYVFESTLYFLLFYVQRISARDKMLLTYVARIHFPCSQHHLKLF